MSGARLLSATFLALAVTFVGPAVGADEAVPEPRLGIPRAPELPEILRSLDLEDALKQLLPGLSGPDPLLVVPNPALDPLPEPRIEIPKVPDLPKILKGWTPQKALRQPMPSQGGPGRGTVFPAPEFDPATGKWRGAKPGCSGKIIVIPEAQLPQGALVEWNGEQYLARGRQLYGPLRGGCLYLGIIENPTGVRPAAGMRGLRLDLTPPRARPR